MEGLIELAKVFGPVAAICIAFSFILLKKHGGLETKLDETNIFIREKLLDETAKTRAALDKNSEKLADNTDALRDLSGSVRECPMVHAHSDARPRALKFTEGKQA